MPDRVTTLELSLAHDDWRREREQHQQSLKLWGQWYREVGGPESWADFADMIRRRNAE